MNPSSPSPPPSALPIEMWSNIFMNIDNPLDLMRVRRVCKQWNQEINRVLEFANWKKLCFIEIRASSLSSIAAVVHPTLSKANYRAIEDQDFWQHVYYHYRKWLRIKELPVRVFKPKHGLLLFIDEFISCFDIWGDITNLGNTAYQSKNLDFIAIQVCCRRDYAEQKYVDGWIIYGTSYGKIYIFQNFEYKKPRRVFNCSDKIKEVKFWYDDNNSLLVLVVTRSRIIKIWNSADKNRSKFILPGHKLCVGTANNLYTVMDYFIMKVQSTPQNISVTTMIRLDLISGEQIVAMNSRESKIFVVVQSAMTLRIFTIEDESFTKRTPTLQIQSVLTAPSLPGISSNLHVYVTLNRTIICTQNGSICLHTPKTHFWMTHNEPMYFNGNVTSLIVHGNYLIIGLSNGILCMYYIDGIGGLLSSNLFKKQPVKMFSLNVLPIIDIKVTDICGVINITAFNRKGMFILTF